MKHLPYLILASAILIYTWLFTSLAFDQHLGMRTHKADLGQIDQAVWNSSRGRFVEMTDNGFIATRMTDHVEPVLALISPIFWLWDDVHALLLLQVLVVAAGTWFVYQLTKKQSITLALTFAIAYLLTPQLQSALLTEFHAAPLAVPLILWAFWAIDRGKLWHTISAILLTASVKEEMALLAAGLGVWAIWQYSDLRFTIYDLRNSILTRSHPRLKVLEKSASISVHPRPQILYLLFSTTFLSLAWFIIATFIIVPAHAVEVYGTAESSYFQRYGALGNSPLDIFTSFFTQPQTVWAIATEPVRLNYLWNLAIPFGLLSLLAPEILLLSLPLLLANLLSAYPAQYYGEFHYSAPLVPYFVVSAIYGTRRLKNLETEFFKKTRFLRTQINTDKRGFFSGILFIWIIGWSGFTYTELGRGPGAARYDPTPINDHHRLLQTLVDQLPPDAAVTATAAVHPHISHRRHVYQFPIGLEAPGQADWALLDVTTATDMAPGDVKQRIEAMLAGPWGVVTGIDGFLLLQKGASAKEIPAAFYDFARQSGRISDTTAQPLKLVHTEIEDRPRWRQTKIFTIWQVGKNFAQQPTLPNQEIRTPSGQTLYTLAQTHSPTLFWYPPEQWQGGEFIRITSLPLYLPQTWGLVTREQNGWQLIQAYHRDTDDQLRMGNTLNHIKSASTAGAFRFTSHDGSQQTLSVDVTLPNKTIWPGGLLDAHLRWTGIDTWPSHLNVFVHLRQHNENRSQSDGPPRYFVFETTNPQHDTINDWRQLPVPQENQTALGETWQLVIGLYDPQSGQRADLLGQDNQPIGNELIVAEVEIVAPPLPDQACALIPATCPH